MGTLGIPFFRRLSLLDVHHTVPQFGEGDQIAAAGSL